VSDTLGRTGGLEGAERERAIRTELGGRVGAPKDIAYGALHLASDEASWVTGTNLVIDGGMSVLGQTERF